MEFASFFNSLGVQVTVVEMMDEILGGMDKELSAMLRAEYAKKGIKFLLSTKVVGVAKEENGVTVSYENAEGAGSVSAEKLLMSVGRRPVMKGFGLENLNLELTERKCVKVDEHMQSSVPGVYVCGDLNGVSLLAHTAVREAEVAVHHILGKEDAMSYRAIPGVVYTNPEIAGAGMSEEALQAAGITYHTIKLPMAYSGRFVAENEGVNGVCKVLTADDGTVLGAHMLGNPASELIVLAGMAIEDRKKVDDWKRYVFPHPHSRRNLHENCKHFSKSILPSIPPTRYTFPLAVCTRSGGWWKGSAPPEVLNCLIPSYGILLYKKHSLVHYPFGQSQPI